jgi:PBP1b-binding outer membrane lipoprotein LpoB
MKAGCLLLCCALMLAGCSQVINYTYSKKNFTSPIFKADLSECKRHRSLVNAYPAEPQELHEAHVRHCMKAKGYRIEAEVR